MTEANDSDSGKGYYRRSEMRRLMSQPVETYRYEEESKRGDGDGAVTARPPVMRRFAAPVQRYANRISMPVLPQGNIHESSPDLQESKTRSGLMSDVELQQGFKYSSNLRALKLLSASSPLITEGPGKDPTDLSHVKSSKYRQRKFLRNFNKQDRLINDFSCALVSDILLQGHLYISENYFAFHSNVFGYITKLLIPLSSVERVTKEKTAKIIPNAVGVVTFTHKYVFGSLLSRDTTFGIMTRVWKQHTPQEPTEAIAIQAPIAEDDSGSGGLNGEEEEEEVNGEDSSSGGGPADLSAAENETTCEPDGVISGTTAPHPDAAAPFRSSSATGMHQHQPLHHSHHIHHHHQHGMIGKSAAFVKGLYSKAMHRGDGDTAPHTGSQGLLASIACVPKITILLSIATILLILLFVAAGFMILRISNVQEQLLMSRAVPRNKMEIYQEVARWQKELHSSLASEVQLTVEKHLSNIAQVRASLDALYTLFPVTGEGLQSTSEPEKTSR